MCYWSNFIQILVVSVGFFSNTKPVPKFADLANHVGIRLYCMHMTRMVKSIAQNDLQDGSFDCAKPLYCM